MTYRFKNNAMKKRTVFIVKHPKSRTVQTVPFVTQIEMMNAPALVQQFTHLVHPNHSNLPFVPASSYCGHGKKSTTIESRQIQKENNEQTDSICDKTFLFSVMILRLTDHG